MIKPVAFHEGANDNCGAVGWLRQCGLANLDRCSRVGQTLVGSEGLFMIPRAVSMASKHQWTAFYLWFCGCMFLGPNSAFETSLCGPFSILSSWNLEDDCGLFASMPILNMFRPIYGWRWWIEAACELQHLLHPGCSYQCIRLHPDGFES